MPDPYDYASDPRYAGVLQSRDPSWRERIASALLGDKATPVARDVMEGVMGSSGGPVASNPSKFGMSLADLTPVGPALSAQEAWQRGNKPEAVADALGAAMPLVGKMGRVGLAGLGAGAAGYFGSTTTGDAAKLTNAQQREQLMKDQEQQRANTALTAGKQADVDAQLKLQQGQASLDLKKQADQREFDRQETLRQSQLPFRQKYPGIASMLPFIGTATAFAAPYLSRIGNAVEGNMAAKSWQRAADEAEKALAGGDKKLIKAKMNALDAHSTEWAKQHDPMKHMVTALTSATLPTEAALVPSEYDLAMLPPGDPNREAAYNQLTDPSALAHRALPGIMAGAPAATLGSKLPIPWLSTPPPSARSFGLLSTQPPKRK